MNTPLAHADSPICAGPACADDELLRPLEPLAFYRTLTASDRAAWRAWLREWLALVGACKRPADEVAAQMRKASPKCVRAARVRVWVVVIGLPVLGVRTRLHECLCACVRARVRFLAVRYSARQREGPTATRRYVPREWMLVHAYTAAQLGVRPAPPARPRRRALGCRV
jgi:hypothetical protein